ncbi:hypothetical protein EYR40_004850 [Pleurotus pulmonarius]|nr:hypothetical protein EYR40_004850 [Pleurotus pulmonarius]
MSQASPPYFAHWPYDNSSTIDSRIFCTYPDGLTIRKKKKPQLSQLDLHRHVHIPSFGTQGTYTRQNSGEWKKYVHLDGSPYWYSQKTVNTHKADDKQKMEVNVLADVDLSVKDGIPTSADLMKLEDDILRETDEFIRIIFDYIWDEDSHAHLEQDIQLVIETTKLDETDYRCGYYFVHHKTRSIFWPEKAELDMEVQYWRHWDYFANTQVVNVEIYNELMDLLIYDIVVQQTDRLSNAYIFSLDELKSYVQHMEQSQKTRALDRESKENGEFNGSPFIIGRLMYAYKRRHFSTYWGEYWARTRHDQWAQKDSHTLFIWAVSPWLFGAPNELLHRLDDIFINNEVAIQPWRELIKHLHAEWQDFILNVGQSAVLLAANVAFLAIQSIDGNKDHPDFRFPSQIASYVSTLMSISSILAGLLLVHHTRAKVHDSKLEALEYLGTRRDGLFGFVPLAIVYSLPYTLLLYAVISFMVAFLLVCFVNTTKVTRGLVGGFGLMCFSLTVGCVMMNWDRGISWWNTWALRWVWRSRKYYVLE